MKLPRYQSLLFYGAFAILSVFLLAIHTHHFHAYNYRQDEAWIVFFALQNTAKDNLISIFIRNLTTFATEFYMIEFWVGLFGGAEPITRYMATLFTALSFAFVWRLASDLFDRRTGFWSVFIFGTLAFVQFFSHEIRPYPALLTGTAAVMLFFIRWLKHRNYQYAILYVLSIVITVYVHPFIVYTVLAQAIFFVLFVRWDWRFYAQTGVLFVASAALSFVRLYATLVANEPGGKLGYGLRQEWESLRILYEQMSIRPEAISHLLLLSALFISVSALFPNLRAHRSAMRFNPEWRKWYLLVVPLAILIISFWINERTRSVTPRNLIILIPPLAIWAAFAIRALPRGGIIAVALLITIPAIQGYRPFVANGPYREIVQTIKPEYTSSDKIIVAADWMWQHVALTYYLRYHLGDPLPNQALYHWMPSNQEWNLFTFPDKPVHLAMHGDARDQASFVEYVDKSRTVWLVRGADYAFTDQFAKPMRDWLEEHYIERRYWIWEQADFYAEHRLSEYRRIPDKLNDIFIFGEDKLTLKSWSLLPDDVQVNPCQTITVESWWQTNQPARTNDNITLVLATPQGQGIVQSDGPPADTLLQLWQPRRLYVDVRNLTIPCDIARGEYVLLVGIYNYETLVSRPITTVDGATVGTRAYLTTLFVD